MWRKPTRRDIAAKLTQAELDKFSTSPDFLSGANPVEDVLELTAETVRGFCRTCKQLKMCPEAGTIPEGLMTFAMDYAAFDILKRISHAPNEARTKAWEAAREMFMAVGKGEYIPDPFIEDKAHALSRLAIALRDTRQGELIKEVCVACDGALQAIIDVCKALM